MLPFGIGFGEVLLIMVVLLLVVGPTKLPDIAKTMAKGLRTARNAGRELRDAIDMEEVRELRRTMHSKVDDWRDEVLGDGAYVEDAEVEPPPALAELHQKPTSGPVATAAAAVEGEADAEGSAEVSGEADDEDEAPDAGPVARDPLSLIRPKRALASDPPSAIPAPDPIDPKLS